MSREPAAGGSSGERSRILAENRRRERDAPGLYATWNPAEQLARHTRRRLAAKLLRQLDLFPREDTRCLEIGFGNGGWLLELLAWGVKESSLRGAEIDLLRAHATRRRLPAAGLCLADAAALPWREGSFELVIASTVFTSVLDPGVRRRLAGEVERVLAPGGALLWYDFAFDSPRNRQVAGIGRRQIRRLFPGLQGPIRSVTLAPPIARRVAPWSSWLAELLEAFPPLRTHRLAVLIKPC
ncbi:MAG: class I SAM-dependent methyltransferase [bacterium]|nr:class I SAM-dependent methyltransferase [bacterium]